MNQIPKPQHVFFVATPQVVVSVFVFQLQKTKYAYSLQVPELLELFYRLRTNVGFAKSIEIVLQVGNNV